jgi:hypothetical protein
MRRPPPARRRWLLAVALGLGLSLALVSAATADRGRYVARSFTEPAKPGLAVSAPLEEFRAVAGARIVVPAEWRQRRVGAGRLRFIASSRHCHYRVTFSVRSLLAAPRDAAAYVADALPSPELRRLLDRGERGGSAFRVVHEQGTATTVRLRALRAAILTRRADIAPPGQVVWSELIVTAASRRGDECHSGTWRDRLGPQLGDTLATARIKLRFVRPGSG